jgi:ABC-type transport system involved in multi-copper enzyme maturation permease subunit
MIWLAWRQFRLQALVGFGLFVAIGIAFALTGPSVLHVYDASVLVCKVHYDCVSATSSFLARDHLLRDLSLAVILVPALLGMFWGAPLVARELEDDTFRLAWTQGVTRARWMIIKLGLVGVASAVVAGLYSLLVTWWSSPFDTINDNPYSVFDLRDVVPIGYAAFAFVLGVTAGVLIRRTLPAMATTLVAFIAVRFAFTEWVRPRLMSPLRGSGPFTLTFNGSPTAPANGNGGDLIISETTYNAKGQVIGHNGGIGSNGAANISPNRHGQMVFQGVGRCPNKFPSGGFGRSTRSTKALAEASQKCVASFHLRDVMLYQPTSRYWTFQWYELTIYIVLALLLASFSIWWVRRRVT